MINLDNMLLNIKTKQDIKNVLIKVEQLEPHKKYPYFTKIIKKYLIFGNLKNAKKMVGKAELSLKRAPNETEYEFSSRLSMIKTRLNSTKTKIAKAHVIIENFKKAITITSFYDKPERAILLLKIAKIFIKLGKIQKAIKIARKANSNVNFKFILTNIQIELLKRNIKDPIKNNLIDIDIINFFKKIFLETDLNKANKDINNFNFSHLIRRFDSMTIEYTCEVFSNYFKKIFRLIICKKFLEQNNIPAITEITGNFRSNFHNAANIKICKKYISQKNIQAAENRIKNFLSFSQELLGGPYGFDLDNFYPADKAYLSIYTYHINQNNFEKADKIYENICTIYFKQRALFEKCKKLIKNGKFLGDTIKNEIIFPFLKNKLKQKMSILEKKERFNLIIKTCPSTIDLF